MSWENICWRQVLDRDKDNRVHLKIFGLTFMHFNFKKLNLDQPTFSRCALTWPGTSAPTTSLFSQLKILLSTEESIDLSTQVYFRNIQIVLKAKYWKEYHSEINKIFRKIENVKEVVIYQWQLFSLLFRNFYCQYKNFILLSCKWIF